MPELSCKGEDDARDRRWRLEFALNGLPQDQRDVNVLWLKRELIEIDSAPTARVA